MSEEVIDLLARKGPLTGAEIREALGGDSFSLWKACMSSPHVAYRRVGRRYVRLDQRVDGYARLSPSILREFLTYTVVGLVNDQAAINLRAAVLADHIADVSRQKLELARSIVNEIMAPFLADPGARDSFCVVVAGDIVYQMAHDVYRPERSTGMMVHGSDIDLVVIVSDDAPSTLVARLDDAIYRKKYQYLKNPAFREEIDYVVKRFSKLREQAEFDQFRRMVACKIFDEAVFLAGSPELFAAGKALLHDRGVTTRLQQMKQDAIAARQARQDYLLATEKNVLSQNDLFHFYTDDEADEFE